MTSSRFDLGPTSKTLNLFVLRFIEQSRSKNLGMHASIFFMNWPRRILQVSLSTSIIFQILNVSVNIVSIFPVIEFEITW